MAYSGAWRRSRAVGDRNPNLGAGVDRIHLDPVAEPDAAVPEPEHGLPVVPAYLYAADDFMLPATVQLVVDPPLDRTPTDPVTGGAERGREADAHFADDGGPRVAHHSPAVMREDAATYRTERAQAAIAVSQSRRQLVAGIDRDGESPQGHYVMRWIDRRYVRRSFTPDAYPRFPYRAATAKQSAPLDADRANQYVSPFARIGQAYKRRVVRPQVRRTPPAYADDVTTDGTDTVSAGFWEF